MRKTKKNECIGGCGKEVEKPEDACQECLDSITIVTHKRMGYKLEVKGSEKK